MKIQLLIALVLAGTSTVATAAPRDDEPTRRVSYTKASPASPSRDWVELATPTPCSHGRTFVTLDPDEPTFTRLRIEAHKGSPVIQRVRVVFADGKERVVKLGKRLDKKRPAYVDLGGGKSIESIVIDSDHRAKGSYTIHGAPDRTAIATR